MTALATKGKRLFDRASKDLGGKGGWLGLEDLNRLSRELEGNFYHTKQIQSPKLPRKPDPAKLPQKKKEQKKPIPLLPSLKDQPVTNLRSC